MGDRAQIKYETPKGVLYFYTHWDGSNLHKILAEALSKGKDRWNDPEYLARIIFSTMIKNNINDNTGYGIGFEEHGDLQHGLIKVNIKTNTVQIGKEKLSFSKYIQKYDT